MGFMPFVVYPVRHTHTMFCCFVLLVAHKGFVLQFYTTSNLGILYLILVLVLNETFYTHIKNIQNIIILLPIFMYLINQLLKLFHKFRCVWMPVKEFVDSARVAGRHDFLEYYQTLTYLWWIERHVDHFYMV